MRRQEDQRRLGERLRASRPPQRQHSALRCFEGSRFLCQQQQQYDQPSCHLAQRFSSRKFVSKSFWNVQQRDHDLPVHQPMKLPAEPARLNIPTSLQAAMSCSAVTYSRLGIRCSISIDSLRPAVVACRAVIFSARPVARIQQSLRRKAVSSQTQTVPESLLVGLKAIDRS